MTREEVLEALINNAILLNNEGKERDVNWFFRGLNIDELKIKPRTITVNGIEVPDPLRVEPKLHDTYWFVCASGVCKDSWNEYPTDKNIFNNGAIHLTQEAAQAHYDALWAPSRVVK